MVARSTLAEKIDFVQLVRRGRIENVNSGVPPLCIPPLTLVDGPNGLAFDLRGVTQLPSSLALAATFDPKLAFEYGEVLGIEARAKGFDAVQAPELNLAQVPQSGRIFEGLGEDPLLASVMGVADANGIQSHGVMAGSPSTLSRRTTRRQDVRPSTKSSPSERW